MDIIDNIIEREGGYVDDPDDGGGPTNMGITLETLAAWREKQRRGVGAKVTAWDVKRLDRAEAYAIYYHEYVTGPGFDQIKNITLRELVVDFGVHSGQPRAGRMLQMAVNRHEGRTLKVDGEVGPKTLAAVNGLPGASLGVIYMGLRVAFMGRVITNKRSQAKWAAGWMNRADKLLRLIAKDIAG